MIRVRRTIGALGMISRPEISRWSPLLTVWVDKNDHQPFFRWIFGSLGPQISHQKPYKFPQKIKTAFFVFWHEWNWFSRDPEADCDWSINNEKGSKIGFVFILSLYSKPTKGRLIRLKYLSLENRTLRNRLCGKSDFGSQNCTEWFWIKKRIPSPNWLRTTQRKHWYEHLWN